MTRALCLLVLLYLFSPLASAQTMNTGLGYCIDGIGEASSTLRSQVAAHTAGRFYGNPPGTTRRRRSFMCRHTHATPSIPLACIAPSAISPMSLVTTWPAFRTFRLR